MESSWATPIDIYCERTDPGLWSEPVNALTNGFFVLAALLAFLRWRRTSPGDWPVLALIVVLTLIGIGSFLFHTVAERWSELADVLPITVFIYVYFFFAIRRFFDAGIIVSGVFTVAFFAVSAVIGAALPSDVLNGSGGYMPALVAILAVGALVVGRKPTIGWLLLASGAIFAISLTARSIDMAICETMPLGTHFIWHTLNALTLYLLLIAMMVARRVSARMPDSGSPKGK